METTFNLEISLEKTSHSRLLEQDINNAAFGKIFSDHIFAARYEKGTWDDLKIIPYGKLSMAPSLSALHYGQTVFEGLKAYRSSMNNRPLLFRPEANYERLNLSAHRLCMPPIPKEIFMEGLKALIRLDADWIPTQEGSDLYIRPVYFAADESIGLKPSESYQFIIMSGPVGPYYAKPVRLLVAEEFVRAFEGGTGAAKTAGNYGGSLLADQAAKEQGYDNILWLDGKHRKYIEECGSMNIAFVINNTVITPKLTGTILAGITRNSILTLLQDMGVQVEERLISIDEVAAAYQQGMLSEVFGMGTAATIAQIAAINYQGQDMNFPPVSGNQYGSMILNQLRDIKTEKVPDPYGWVCKL